METPTVFFSYARNNSRFVVDLAKRLKASNIDVWLDQIDIPAGARWDMEIQKALAKANTLLVILSPDSVTSNNVLDEVSYAIEEGKNIVPILYQECDIPFRLRRFQYIDFSKDERKGFEILRSYFTDKTSSPQLEKGGVKSEIKDAESILSPPLAEKTTQVVDKKTERSHTATARKPKAEKKKINLLLYALPLVLATLVTIFLVTRKSGVEPTKPSTEDSASVATPTNETTDKESEIEVLDAAVLADEPKEEEIWEYALKSNTVEGYQEYLSQFKEGEYIEQANQNIKDINGWEQAKTLNTVDAYLAYISQFGKNALFEKEVEKAVQEAPSKIEGWLYAGRTKGDVVTSDKIFELVCCSSENIHGIAHESDIVKNVDFARRVYPSYLNTSGGDDSLPTIKNNQLGYISEVKREGSTIKYRLIFSK